MTSAADVPRVEEEWVGLDGLITTAQAEFLGRLREQGIPVNTSVQRALNLLEALTPLIERSGEVGVIDDRGSIQRLKVGWS